MLGRTIRFLVPFQTPFCDLRNYFEIFSKKAKQGLFTSQSGAFAPSLSLTKLRKCAALTDVVTGLNPETNHVSF
jgi:hypothetical protein